MTQKNLTIHSENILPIIKKWLYSDKDIFSRELVSNAVDALRKVKILRDQGKAAATDDEFRIDIKIDKENKTLKFIDTGIGMDAKEVENYIAQIAFSSAEEFLEKYQSDVEGDQFIGHFGLGFYSAYMVARKVEIDTLSYKEGAEPVFWSCDGTSTYTIEKGSRAERGTEITLFIEKESEEFLDEHRLQEALKHYCAFLPYPVYLGDKRINTHEPLWIKNPAELKDSDYLAFYRYLYPGLDDPHFWIHLNVDYPFHLKGILYFPKLRHELDLNKNTIKLYCNRVFVSDNCKDLIPDYLMVLQGVIDSPDIPLNVSRSYLQMDRTVRQLAGHISKKVTDNLAALYRNDKEKYVKSWDDISAVVKLGAMEDQKFYDRIKDFIIWKVAQGDWTTAEAYLEAHRDKTGNKIIYTRDEEQLPHIIDLYREKGTEVIVASSPIDNYMMQFLEGKLAPARFQRIDAHVGDALLDKTREKSVLDADGRTEAGKLAEFVQKKLGDEMVEVEAKSLAADHLPGFVVIDEGQRRMRDYLMSMSPKDAAHQIGNVGKRKFVVNTNNPMMSMVQSLDKTNPDLAQDIVKELYDLSLLSQREMDPKLLSTFINRSNIILEKLTKAAIKS